MTEADVAAALCGRWPDDAYLHIREAPTDASRQGRKLDVLVVSLWRSRGYALDGVEIKCSLGDWHRERKDPSKAEWWWAHCNRFWIAAPTTVATKIRPELPEGWGLLGVDGRGVRVVEQPTANTDREPLDWPQTIGLLRATADSGLGALDRAERRGFDRGMEAAQQRPEWNAESADSREIQRLRHDHERLSEAVATFEEASGLRLGQYRNDVRRLGALVRIVNEAIVQGPDVIGRRLADATAALRSIAEVTDKLNDAMAAGFEEA